MPWETCTSSVFPDLNHYSMHRGKHIFAEPVLALVSDRTKFFCNAIPN